MQNMLSTRFNTFTICLFVFGFLLCSILPTHTSAQAPSFVPKNIYLEASPQYPEPNSSILVSLNDYSVNALGATISWFINGVEQVSSKNERSIKIPSHELGTQEVVKVVLSRTNAPSLSATLTVSPVVLDIIFEANTYVPSFYRGRALPSEESTMRAIALLHDATGSIKNDYTYRWLLGDTVLHGGPMKGKNAITYTMPLFQDADLTVEVFDTKGVLVGKKTITVDAVEPKLLFYEYNSLRGLSERAVTKSLPLIGEETTLYGEPYFMNTDVHGSDSSFSWMINGAPITTNPTTPNAITLRKDGEGSSVLSLKVVTQGRIPQFVMQQLQLIF